MDTSQRHEEPIDTNNTPADCLESSQCIQQGWHTAQEAVPDLGRPEASNRRVATRPRPSRRERAGFIRLRDGSDDSESDQLTALKGCVDADEGHLATAGKRAEKLASSVNKRMNETVTLVPNDLGTRVGTLYAATFLARSLLGSFELESMVAQAYLSRANQRAMLWAMVMDVYRGCARAVYFVSKVVATLWCVFFTALSPLWFTFVQHFVFEFVKSPFTAMTIPSMAVVFGPPAVTITIGRVWPELAAQVVVGVIQFIMFQWCVIFLLVILIPFLESLGTVTWCVVLAILFGVSLTVVMYERYRVSRSVWESAFCCLARLPWGAYLRRERHGYTLTPDVEMGGIAVSGGDVLWQRRGWLVMLRARARRGAVHGRGAASDGLGRRQLLIRCHARSDGGVSRRPSVGLAPLWDVVAGVVELEQPELFAAIVRFL